MRRSSKIALIGAILMSCQGILFATGPIYRLYAPEITVLELPVAVAGWAIASYGPLLVAVLFWRWADRFSRGWLLHILLLPCLYAVLLAGWRIMGSTVVDSDFDSTLGAPIMPSLLCAIVVMTAYYAALAGKLASRQQR